jgi:hypothetical protein
MLGHRPECRCGRATGKPPGGGLSVRRRAARGRCPCLARGRAYDRPARLPRSPGARMPRVGPVPAHMPGRSAIGDGRPDVAAARAMLGIGRSPAGAVGRVEVGLSRGEGQLGPADPALVRPLVAEWSPARGSDSLTWIILFNSSHQTFYRGSTQNGDSKFGSFPTDLNLATVGVRGPRDGGHAGPPTHLSMRLRRDDGTDRAQSVADGPIPGIDRTGRPYAPRPVLRANSLPESQDGPGIRPPRSDMAYPDTGGSPARAIVDTASGIRPGRDTPRLQDRWIAAVIPNLWDEPFVEENLGLAGEKVDRRTHGPRRIEESGPPHPSGRRGVGGGPVRRHWEVPPAGRICLRQRCRLHATTAR